MYTCWNQYEQWYIEGKDFYTKFWWCRGSFNGKIQLFSASRRLGIDPWIHKDRSLSLLFLKNLSLMVGGSIFDVWNPEIARIAAAPPWKWPLNCNDGLETTLFHSRKPPQTSMELPKVFSTKNPLKHKIFS